MRSRIYAAVGYLLGNTGGTQALDACDRAVALARSAHDSELLGWTLTQFAVAAMDKRRRGDAEAALAEAEQLFGAAPQAHQRARILAVRLHIVRLAGEIETALEISKELSTLYRRLGNLSGELRATLNHAESLHACGNTLEAIDVVREALGRAQDDREAEGSLLLNLTAYYAAAGDAGAAMTTGIQAIEVFVPAGAAGGSLAMSIGHTALAHALSGDVQRAAMLAAYWNEVSHRLGIVREFTERVTQEKLSALFASRLSPAELANLTASGSALEPREAIAMALGR
jgi:tetratricopeptide (TPR) repeat protein